MASVETGILVARVAFHTPEGVVRKGQTFRPGHPLLEGRESLVKPLVVDYELPEPAPKRGRHAPASDSK